MCRINTGMIGWRRSSRFESLQARAALRDVGRVFEMPYGQVDRIAKLVPNNPAKPTTIAEALVSEDEFRKQHFEDEQVADLIDVSMKLEGFIVTLQLMPRVL